MKQLTVIIFIITRSISIFAQDNTRLNLNQCIAIALKNNIEVQKSTIQTESDHIGWQQKRADLLKWRYNTWFEPGPKY